jgi:hypothetical protein
MTAFPLLRLLALTLCVLAALQTRAQAATAADAGSGARDFSGAWSIAAQAPAAAPTNSPAGHCAPTTLVPGIARSGLTHIVTGRGVMILVQEDNRLLRHVYLGGEHPKGLQTSVLGHSVGQFEGDTLVVETIGLPTGMTLVERFRKVDAGRQLEITANGNAMLAQRRADALFDDNVCNEATAGTGGAGNITARAAAESRPSFEGVWQIERPVTTLKAADGQVPPLKPAARTLYRQRVLKFRAGDATPFDGSGDCRPVGEPRASNDGAPFEIVQGNDTIFIGYSQRRMMRFAYLGDRLVGHQAASYGGRWTARWDGDVLVLEGSGFNPDSVLDEAGLPHSDQLRMVQRLSLQKGGAALVIHSSFDDPQTFTRTWTTQQRYRRLPAAAISQAACPRQEKHDG